MKINICCLKGQTANEYNFNQNYESEFGLSLQGT